MYVKVWEKKKRVGPPGPPITIRLKFGTKGIPPFHSITFNNLFNGYARVVEYDSSRSIYYVEFMTRGFKGIGDISSLISEARFIASVLTQLHEIYADIPDRYALPGIGFGLLGTWKFVELLKGLLKGGG